MINIQVAEKRNRNGPVLEVSESPEGHQESNCKLPIF